MMMVEIKKNSNSGWVNGFIGVVLFSGSLPATRVAVLEFDPIFLTVVRASIAGMLALIALFLFKEKRPKKEHIIPLIIVAIGVVIGFPLLTAIALQKITSAHSIVFLGILPMVTAVFGIMRGGELPRPIFWLFSIIGSALVVGYAVFQGITASPTGDILMIVAVVLCGLGYAEGAKLTKALGGWQVISWALVISLPVMLVVCCVYMPSTLQGISGQAWTSLAYVSSISMFVAFIFWYKGLAEGGTASVGQLQLLQPLFGLTLAGLLLRESVDMRMMAVTLGVILCVAGTKKFAK